MKKILSLAVVCCMLVVSAMAQNYEVKRSDASMVAVHLESNQPKFESVDILGSSFYSISMKGFEVAGEVGSPALPAMTKLMEIPICSEITFELSNIVADTLDGAMLGCQGVVAPFQPSRRKSDRSTPVLSKNNHVYATNAFVGKDLISVEKIGIARSRNMASFCFSPVQYNPVTNQFIIVKSVDVTFRFVGADMAATNELKNRYASQTFGAGISTINAIPFTKEASFAGQAPVHYLIVAHSSFRGELDSLIAWKQKKGFIVTVGYTDDAGVGTTTTSIRNYIKGFYTNATPVLPAPTYLLLVGDIAQIPAFNGQYTSSSSHVTDLNYATWTDGDIIPDCYYGRFSAQNVNQLTPQIEKTLMYERYAFPDPSFLTRSVLIAGVDQGYSSDYAYRYADPAMDYIAKTYVNQANGFATVNYFKNNTNFQPTGVTVTGSSQASSTASTLIGLYNQGAGWINYSAHGDVDEWSIPSFTNSNVNSMANTNKFGVMIGNCCLTNSFQENTCFGEALLRKPHAGAVLYFGGSDYTYWSEDFYWSVGLRQNVSNTCDPSYDPQNLGMYDRLFHTHGENPSEWYTSAGSIMMAGNMAVQASTSSLKNYYWEVYHIMGDPSIMPWLSQPGQLNVEAETVLLVGANTLNLTTTPNAYCALTDGQGTLLGAAYADAQGSATIHFDPIAAPGTYELAVTAQNRIPRFIPIDVTVTDGPYVMPKAIRVANNGTLVAGQNVTFDVDLKNVGTEATSTLSIEAIVNGNHLFLTTPGQITTANVQANDSITASGLISAQVLNNVADQTTTTIQLIARWGNHTDQKCSRYYTFTINAPAISKVSQTIQGTLEANNTVTLTITEKNQGHATFAASTVTLVSPEVAVNVTSQPVQLGAINANASTTINHTLSLGENLPNNCEIPLYQVIENNGSRIVEEVKLVLGHGAMETFETADFSCFAWQQNENPWEITTNGAFGGTYCAKSKTYSNGQGNSSTSELSIEWNSTIDDSISFYYNVSSESGYDKFIFYIDGRSTLEASGQDNEWTRVSYFIPAGTHTFKFSYEKDYSMSRGSDCAWVDNITFPLAGIQRTYALDTICQGELYNLLSHQVNTTGMAAGNYYLSDTTATRIHQVLLTIVAVPEITIEADHTTIAVGQNVLLTASGANRYEWNTGETTAQIRQYPTETTTYSVTGYNGSCSSSASITINVEGTIGINGVEQKTMSVYPNPTSGTISINNINSDEVILYDMTGRCVLKEKATSHSITLNLNSLPKGIYMLRSGAQVKKIVKK